LAKYIFTKEIAYRKMQRMAYEVVERNMDEKEIIIAGIKESGSIIAGVLTGFLKDIFAGEIKVLDIIIDKKEPKKISLSESMDFNDKVIIVCDDVSNSGRTLLYALKPFIDYYPKKIQSLVLLERSYREFPVASDYVGMSVATALSERIIVETDSEGITGARLE
jgi:pyrimidine operon attenuation protein/uracil phosphoribosyltransferase